MTGSPSAVMEIQEVSEARMTRVMLAAGLAAFAGAKFWTVTPVAWSFSGGTGSAETGFGAFSSFLLS